MYVVAAQRITLAHHIKGGMEVQADMLYRGLAERGCDVEVITTAHPTSLREIDEGGVHFHYLPHSDPRRYTNGWWRDSYTKLKELVYRGRADVLLSQSAGALGYFGRARKDLRLPGVVLVHMGLGAGIQSQWRAARSPRGLLRLAYMLVQAPDQLILWRRAVAVAEAVITTSEETEREVQTEFGADPARVRLVPTGVDVHHFAPSPAVRQEVRAALGLPADRFLVMAASRLTEEKGVQVAMRALAGIPEATLLVAGDGPYARSLEQQQRALGLADRVRFLGFVQRTDLNRYLAAADVFVMPTLYREGFPASIIEAMACGLAVAASNLGGIPTAITSERTGLLVRPGNADSWRSALMRLMRDPELRRQLGDAARAQAVERFSVERMVSDTLAVLEEAASHKGRPRL